MTKQVTHIERTMPGFDPEKHCRYTGMKLIQVPSRYCDGRLFVWYVREDGCNMRTEPVTGEALLWANKHPKETQNAIDRGKIWHAKAIRQKYEQA